MVAACILGLFWTFFGRLVLLFVAGDPLKVGVWIRPVGLSTYIRMTQSVSDSFF